MGHHPKIKGRSPTTKETPRVEVAKPTDELPVWRVAKLDSGGDWCAHQMNESEFRSVLDRLKSLETMKWSAIEQAGSHFNKVADLIPDAQRRLRDLKLDDFDPIFSLRMSGKPRLWGIRIRNVFSALWWDRDHAICPSPKKHT